MERVTEATVRAPDGRVFRGGTHAEALEAMRAAAIPDDVIYQSSDGFSTTMRDHVSREEAYEVARNANQWDSDFVDASEEIELVGSLDAREFVPPEGLIGVARLSR